MYHESILTVSVPEQDVHELQRPGLSRANPLSPLDHLGPSRGCPTGDREVWFVWSRIHSDLHLSNKDYMIDDATDKYAVPGDMQLWRVLKAVKADYVVFVGVHLNVCMMNRQFGLGRLRQLGWPKERLGVVRELTDVLYCELMPTPLHTRVPQ